MDTNVRLAIESNSVRITKANIAAEGHGLASQILEAGHMSPLEATIRLRAMQDTIQAALDELKSHAMNQVAADRGDNAWLGVRCDVKNGATRYDYSADGAWNAIKANEEQLAQARKAREKFLQALQAEVVDPETGEYISPAKVASIGDPVLSLTFPKL